MNGTLPDAYKDYPTSYVGQPLRSDGDDYSTYRDVSKPSDIGRERGPMDALDPDKPVGMQQAPKPDSNKKSIKWKKRKKPPSRIESEPR